MAVKEARYKDYYNYFDATKYDLLSISDFDNYLKYMKKKLSK